MTDNENREAFCIWFAHPDRIKDGLTLSVYDGDTVWQAAVEWATKRERERCWKIADTWMRNGMDAAQKATALMIMKEIEEVDQPEPLP